jgi:hypothetical protein
MGIAAAAGITAVAAIGGAAISSSASKKAANKAADAATQNAEASNALQSQIYGENKALLSPYVNRGNSAGDAINALLGLGGPLAAAPAQGTQQYGPAVPATTGGTYGGGGLFGNVPVNSGFGNVIGALGGMGGQQQAANQPPYVMVGGKTYANTADAFADPNVTANQRQELMMALQMQGYQLPQTAQPAVPAASSGTGSAAAGSPYDAAFKNYLGSTGYQFQIDQGNKGINQGYAAKGALQSGAALKALQTYGQNTATGFFKDYLGLLSNQQAVGLSGAGAVAGVGTGYANSVSANNANASNAIGNAALASANGTNNAIGTAVGGIQSAANMFGSSYAPKNAMAPIPPWAEY